MSALSTVWNHTIFYKSDAEKGVWVLAGFPLSYFSSVMTRLFSLRCEYVAAGSTLEKSPWVAFKTKKEVAASLALLFKAPAEKEPLIVKTNRNGEKVVLTGVAEREARVTLKFNRNVAKSRSWEVQKVSNAVEVEVLTEVDKTEQEETKVLTEAGLTGHLSNEELARMIEVLSKRSGKEEIMALMKYQR